MAEPKDGGPAFPPAIAANEAGIHHGLFGMSLRDWFAGQALPAFITTLAPYTAEELSEAAQRSYAAADAMLAAARLNETESGE